RVLALLVGILAVVMGLTGTAGFTAPAAADQARSDGPAGQTPPAAGAQQTRHSQPTRQAEPVGHPEPVVVIGAAGLSWEDITAETTPALWSLAEDSVGSLVVRSVRRSTCPLDGWLGLNTGERSADVSSRCRGLTEPVDGRISDWPQISAAVADQNFGARLGTFSELLERAGVRATSIGPGAAVALAGA